MNHHSNTEENGDDLAIRKYYQALQAEEPAQREAVLARWEASPMSATPIFPSRSRRLRLAALALAIVALVMVSALWELKTPGVVYGADDLLTRLMFVDSLRMKGWQFVPAPQGLDQPATKLPFELTIKRPGQYRHTFHSVSENGTEQTIMTGYQLCDGHYETAVNDLSREYYRVPVQPLDAILKTEELAQGTAMTMVLGPADLRFRRVGVEPVGEIACDLYVGSFAKSTAVRVWLNPVTGWPVRITHEDIDGAGKSTTRMEIVEIAINEENPDSQFLFTPPEGYVDRMAELIKSLPAPLAQPGNSTENNKLPALTIQATGSAGGGDQSLEKWHGFLLSSTSALFVWKRSVPTKKESETLDWLQNIEMDYRNGNGVSRPLRHAWVQPPQPSQWLWSIVKTVDGKPLGRGIIHLQLRADRAELSCGFAALQLTNEMLDELIPEAAKSAGVPASAEPITLQFLRAKAAELK